MAFTVNFTDNSEVLASELNLIAKSIDESASESIVFVDGKTYGVDDLNSITSVLITKGVAFGLNVILSGDSVTISQGRAFFEDGKRLEVDGDGVVLNRPEGEDCYVWFSNNKEAGSVSAKCTKEAPSGDYVMLCTISEDGIITEKKDICVMKNASLLPNFYENVKLNISSGDAFDGDEFTFNVPSGHTRYIIKGYQKLYYIDAIQKTVTTGSQSGIVTVALADYPISISHEAKIYITSYENGVLTCRLSYTGFLNSISEIIDIDFI